MLRKIWTWLIGRQRVFVGCGSWDDCRNWAKSSYGVAGAAVPTIKDDVYIPLGTEVHFDGDGMCRNLTIGGSMLVR